MLYYPGQDQRSEEIATRFSAEFDFASRLFSSWLLRPKNKWIAKSPLPYLVKNLAVMLDQQAIRQFRSIVDLCSQGEATNASMIVRSLYETALAMFFVLKPRLCIPIVPILDKAGQPKPEAWQATIPAKKSVRKKTDHLSRHFRARLYFANMTFSDDQFVKRHSATPGRKLLARQIAPSVDKAMIAAAEKAIKEKWTFVLRHSPHSYSGLRIAALAKVLGNQLDKWYDTIYHFQSRAVHASDAAKSLRSNERTGAIETAAFCRDEEIPSTLTSGCTMFLACASMMSDYIGMGVATDTLLYWLRKELPQYQ